MNLRATFGRLLLPQYRVPFLSIFSSGVLEAVTFWQLEIVTKRAADGIFLFEFPFFIGGEINLWWARDFWYVVGGIAFLLFGGGMYSLGKR